MYHRRVQGWMKHGDFLLGELICFQLAFIISCVMRHGWVNPYSSVLYRNTAIVAALIQIFVIISFNVFKNILRRGYYREFVNSVKTVCVVMLLLVLYLFLIRQGTTFSRMVLISTSVYYWVFCYTFRSLRKYFLRAHLAENAGGKSLVIITEKRRARQVISHIQSRNVDEFKVTGLILLDEEGQSDTDVDGVPVVSGRAGAEKYLCRDWVDEVFLDIDRMDDQSRELMYLIADMSMTLHLRVGTKEELPITGKELQKIGDYTVITMSPRILRFWDSFIKRALDLAGGIVGCLFTGILFLVLAPVIYRQSPGPVFFSQMRVGRNGKIFRMWKFRSMYLDAEERKSELADRNEVQNGMMFKIENDPRVIGSEKGPGKGIGNFIRRFSLDEFPQFLNVLKGDMSLVGTRPPTLDEWERYNPHHRGRLSVKPGLTGLWQISGRSDIQDFEEVVALDRQYITEWTIGMDIKILLKTVLTVFKGEGAR